MPHKKALQHHCQKSFIVIAAAIFLLFWPSLGLGQSKTATSKNQATSLVTQVGETALEQLRTKRKAIEASEELSDSLKKSVLSLLDQAIRFRESAAQFEKAADETARHAKAAPDRIKKIETLLKAHPRVPDNINAIAAKMSPDRLTQKARQEEAALADAKTVLRDWTGKLLELKDRPQQLRQSMARAKERLGQIQQESRISKPGDHPLVAEARQEAFAAEQAKSLAEISSYEQDLVAHDALTTLFNAERELAQKELTAREASAKAWQALAQQAREKEAIEAKEEAAEARREAESLPPAIQEQFDINVKLGEKLEQLTIREASLAGKLESTQAQLKALEEDFTLARARVEATVLTETIGLALREQRQNLPSQPSFRRDSAARRLLMSEIRDEQFKIVQEKRRISDLETATRQLMQGLEDLSRDQANAYTAEARKLLSSRLELFGKLEEVYRRLFKLLQDLEFTEQQLMTTAEDYAEFLDGHLLWLRSSKIFNADALKNIPSAVGWFFRPAQWQGVLQDARLSIKRLPEWWILGLLIALILFVLYTPAKKDLGRVAVKVGHVYSDSFVLTMRALVMTALMALPWAFLAALPAWCLSAVPTAYDFTRALSSALLSISGMLWLWLFFFNIFRKEGLGETHFKWHPMARSTWKRNLLWYIPLLVVTEFLISVYDTGAGPEYRDSLGRVFFLIRTLVIAAGIAWVFRYSSGIATTLAKERPKSWLVRLRYGWYPLAIFIPLAVGFLSFIGFGYSATALSECVRITVWLFIMLVLANNLVLRWLFLVRKRLAWQEYKRKRKEAQEARAAKEQEGIAAPEEEPAPIREEELDLGQIDEQTRALLRIVMFFAGVVGLWAIWGPMLPALNVIGDTELWTYSKEVDGLAKTLPITLANLILAVIILFVTIAAVKNIPGLLDMILLSRLRMDPGLRYAITTLCRYALIAVGVITAFAMVGMILSDLKWLIAALGVGLGFGLQEIVANFICGLIILFERPYRLGDIVTVGDLSGTVTRIRIRATTITDWDRRELIVPNKEFVTGKLINWSLSDPITRIVIPVGVVYGSDTDLTEQLLLKAAQEDPMVLDKPEPTAFFLGFGDNSLNFELRVFIQNPFRKFEVTDRLHHAIDNAFREAGIIIAFPQRDVHMDTTKPLDVRLVPGSTPKKDVDPGSEPDRGPSF